MINKDHVISRLIISQSITSDPMQKELIEQYQSLISLLSDKDFELAVKHPIRRDPQSIAERLDNEDAWEWFATDIANKTTPRLLAAWD